jgi:CubicO group peptidase (beta-lactamase class C family)
MILKNMGNKSKVGVSIVLGVITPNGTSVSGYGNISKANTTKVNGNTIFDIASITKTIYHEPTSRCGEEWFGKSGRSN